MSVNVDEIKERFFKNHFIRYKRECDVIKIYWGDGNNDSIYNIRYTFDGNEVYIASKLGDIVIQLSEKADIEGLSKYSLKDFNKKIVYKECKKYDFDNNIAIDNINYYIAENKELNPVIQKFLHELINNLGKISYKILWFSYIEHVKSRYNLKKYNYSWLYEAGNNENIRVFIYWVGILSIREFYNQKVMEANTIGNKKNFPRNRIYNR